MTCPAGTVSLHWSMACPTTRPAPWMAACAVAWFWPVTSGTVTVQGPEDTVSCTTVPGVTWAPADGFWEMTWFAGTVLLHWLLTLPTFRPTLASAAEASDGVSPVTFGTVMNWGGQVPVETTKITGVFALVRLPAGGVWLMMVPAATVLLHCSDTCPTVKPA